MPGQFKIFVTLVLMICFVAVAASQSVQIISSSSTSSLRGLSVVTDKIVWVSGSGGTVGKSVDGGQTFKWMQVAGFEKTDFRDIEAFSENTAIIMGIASPAYILKTTNGGDSWKVVYENKDTAMFLDAMEFWDDNNGRVIGDPANGYFFMASTSNGGLTWTPVSPSLLPVADSGEACFASSGTNIRQLNAREAVFVSGGLKSHVFIGKNKKPVPFTKGVPTAGGNSIAVKNEHIFIITGGDFTKKDSTGGTCFITSDGGKSWSTPRIGPRGYRSCVEYLGEKNWIACGLNGVDLSTDEGTTWIAISGQSFHVCRKAKNGKAVFFAGGKGNIGKLVMP